MAAENPTCHSIIVGAGPYSLSIAAMLKSRGINAEIIGRSGEFWQKNMPRGMFLRSSFDWHLDPLNVHTFEAFIKEKQIDPNSVTPIPRDLAIDYFGWFRSQYELSVTNLYLDSLRYDSGIFHLDLSDGSKRTAKNVVVAPGIRYFPHVPAELAALIPASRMVHTCDVSDFSTLKDKRCVIIGGRQSAFESAALLAESGAKSISVVCRHETPEFTESDWSWTRELAQRTLDQPCWFRELTEEERERLNHSFWCEGRAKLEPWLAPRLDRPEVQVIANANLVSASEDASGVMELRLDTGEKIVADHIVFATGYKVEIRRLPFLQNSGILEQIKTKNGIPELDSKFQSSLPGLFFTGLIAARDFGPIFGFLLAAPVSGKIIGEALAKSKA